ncbi:NnrS family protein, partial [Oceanibaculum nanhaiense]|uniref:NnrS family protein n=1 Tax=Oceanibaculum nanhaiense TaxID=1909734 RepID=UPI00396D0F62
WSARAAVGAGTEQDRAIDGEEKREGRHPQQTGPALFPALTLPSIAAAGLLWMTAFTLFLAVYGPILLRPRADGRPG